MNSGVGLREMMSPANRSGCCGGGIQTEGMADKFLSSHPSGHAVSFSIAVQASKYSLKSIVSEIDI